MREVFGVLMYLNFDGLSDAQWGIGMKKVGEIGLVAEKFANQARFADKRDRKVLS